MKYAFLFIFIPLLSWADRASDAQLEIENDLATLQKMLADRADLSESEKETFYKENKRTKFAGLCLEWNKGCEQLSDLDKELVERRKKRDAELKVEEAEYTKKLGEGWQKARTEESKEALIRLTYLKDEKNKSISADLCKKSDKDTLYCWSDEKQKRNQYLLEEEICLVERTFQVEKEAKGQGGAQKILEAHEADYAKHKSCKAILDNDKKAIARLSESENRPSTPVRLSPPRRGPNPPKEDGTLISPRSSGDDSKQTPPSGPSPEGNKSKVILKASIDQGPKAEASIKKVPTDEETMKVGEDEKIAQVKADAAAKKAAEDLEENEDEKSPRNYDPETCEWVKDLPRRVVYGPGCGKNMSRICTGHVVCNQKVGGAKFVRMSTCGAEHCGASSRDAINCTKQLGYFSRRAKDESKEFMTQKVKKVIQGSTKQ